MVSSSAWVIVGILCSLVAGAAGGEPVLLALTQASDGVDLAARVHAFSEPVDRVPDPDAYWARPDAPRAAADGPGDGKAEGRWRTEAGQRLVGRATLMAGREKSVYVVFVPSARVDQVQVWYRLRGGGSWQSGLAGDRVPLSRWPFVGPYPAFPLALDERPLDLVVTVVNDGLLRVPVRLLPDAAYREMHTRQAQVSGLIAGLGLMVLVICVISYFVLRRRANVLLAAVAAWGLFSIMCINGDTAIWLTPEWPEFNHAGKHLSSVMLSALMVSMTVHALDERFITPAERVLAWAAPVAGLAYALLQAMWLPGDWRAPGALAWAGLAGVAALVVCGLSALQGGRFVPLVTAAVLGFVASVAVLVADWPLVRGLDLQMTGAAILIFASLLLMRHALFSRERYGRDVVGRAAISAHRDPLTALLSYSGFQQSFDEAVLRQAAGGGPASIMLFALPGLEAKAMEHGFVLTERALVRFAAALQSVLGNTWTIARLSKTRFACLSMQPQGAAGMMDDATRLLSHCTRLTEPLGPVADFDLRIACTHRQLSQADLSALIRELDDAVQAQEPGKRIALV
jgi:GGDEF domain-containing protein